MFRQLNYSFCKFNLKILTLQIIVFKKQKKMLNCKTYGTI